MNTHRRVSTITTIRWSGIDPPIPMKKHEAKHIESDVKQLQRWVEAYSRHQSSYLDMGFDEAARRSRIATSALILARETMQYGVPSNDSQAELSALLAAGRDR